MKRAATSAANLTPPGVGYTTEQVIATVPMPALGDNPLTSGVLIDAIIASVTGGTLTTGLAFRVRRTNVSGAQVGSTVSYAGTAPLSVNNVPIQVLDSPTPATAVYVVTCQATAATSMFVVGYMVATATAA